MAESEEELKWQKVKRLQMVTAVMKLKNSCPLEEKLDSVLKSRDITLPTKVWVVKAMVFLVVMYGCENWTTKKAEHQRIDAFDLWCWMGKTLESPLDSKGIKPVNPKGNQPQIFTGRADTEALILWPPDAKNRFMEKTLMLGKIEGRRERELTEDEMVEWHH